MTAIKNGIEGIGYSSVSSEVKDLTSKEVYNQVDFKMKILLWIRPMGHIRDHINKSLENEAT